VSGGSTVGGTALMARLPFHNIRHVPFSWLNFRVPGGASAWGQWKWRPHGRADALCGPRRRHRRALRSARNILWKVAYVPDIV
jgi:hypothetical protein